MGDHFANNNFIKNDRMQKNNSRECSSKENAYTNENINVNLIHGETNMDVDSIQVNQPKSNNNEASGNSTDTVLCNETQMEIDQTEQIQARSNINESAFNITNNSSVNNTCYKPIENLSEIKDNCDVNERNQEMKKNREFSLRSKIPVDQAINKAINNNLNDFSSPRNRLNKQGQIDQEISNIKWVSSGLNDGNTGHINTKTGITSKDINNTENNTTQINKKNILNKDDLREFEANSRDNNGSDGINNYNSFDEINNREIRESVMKKETQFNTDGSIYSTSLPNMPICEIIQVEQNDPNNLRENYQIQKNPERSYTEDFTSHSNNCSYSYVRENNARLYPKCDMIGNQNGFKHQEEFQHYKNVDNNSRNVYDDKNSLKVILPSEKIIKFARIINNTKKFESKRYWDIISKNFNVHSVNFTSIEAVENAIKNCSFSLRNSKFVELHKLPFEDKIIIPKIIEHALNLRKINRMQLLQQKDNKKIILSQQEISFLLANAFLCTFHETTTLCPNINFDRLFIRTNNDHSSSNVKIEKLKCIMNYFKRVLSEPPKGMVSFERRYLQSHEIPKWNTSTKALSRLFVHSEGSIEMNGKDMLQVDFANKMVGGGVLNNGSVQEEIRFCMNPELIISRLFTEKLLEEEVLIIKGTEQFNEYEGYGSTFKWRNNHYDKTSYDGQFRNTTIVAMDALKFSESEKFSQFNSINFNRELSKAYCGFMDKHYKSHQAIATGSWGCGVFNGNKILKAIIQFMAASESEKDLHYFTFGDNKLKNELEDLYNFFRNKHFQVKHLYKAVRLYDKHVISRSNSYKQNLIKYIMDSAYYIFK